MKQIGSFKFPETEEEREGWHPYVQYRALACRVLVVMQTRIEGSWSAYCDAVPGHCHHAEMIDVLDNGDKVPEAVARLLFSFVPDDLPY